MNTDTNTEKPDYEIAREELKNLFDSLNFTSSVARTHFKTKDESGWEHKQYRVIIQGVTFTYKMGLGCKGAPEPAEVLACYCREFIDAKDQTFEEWCSNFGYSDDSIKAKNIYEQCFTEGETIERLWPEDSPYTEQFAELANRL